MKKILTGVFVVAMIFSVFPPVASAATTWTVCSAMCDYTTIQAANDDDVNVLAGDTISVTENQNLGAASVAIDKALTIQCSNGVTLTNGAADGSYVSIQTGSVTLSNCTLQIDTCDATDTNPTVGYTGGDVTISGNTFTNVKWPMAGDGNATVQNNTFSGICGRGIQLTDGAGTLTVDNNTFSSADGGRMIYLVGQNSGTIVCTDNTISQTSSTGAYPAIILSDNTAATTFTVTGNTVKAISGANGFSSGVTIGDNDGKNFANVTIQNNIFNGVDGGIDSSESSIADSNISHNTIYGPTGTGLFGAGSGTGKTIENLVLKYNIVYFPASSSSGGVAIGSNFTVANFTEDYNAYWNSSASCVDVSGASTGSHSLCSADNSNAVDPAFTDAASDDFTLLPFSYMIGYADDSSDLGAEDYSGSRRTTIYVDDNGVVDYVTCDFNDIDSAVDVSASSGDTVIVAAGTYAESVTIADKSLTLQGAQTRSYTMKNSPYSYGGNDYDSGGYGGLYTGKMLLIYDDQNAAACGVGDYMNVDAGAGDSYNEDITSSVSAPPANYAVALVTEEQVGAAGSVRYTILFADTCSTDPNSDCFTTQAQIESYLDVVVSTPACNTTSYTVDYFENDIYTYDTSTKLYTYHTPADAGVTVVSGYPDPPSITIASGTATTIDATGESYGISLSNVDSSTISGFTVQDATTADVYVAADSDGNTLTDFILSGVTSSSTYLMNKHSYSYDGTDWNTGSGSTATGGGILLYGAGNMAWFEADGTDIGSYVGGTPQDWHLGLVTAGGLGYTVYHRADSYANQAAAQVLWGGMGATVEHWFADVFTYADSAYTYNAPTGPTVMGAYSSPPDVSTAYSGGGLVFSSSDTNTVSNVTFSSNTVGVNFLGTASGNILKDSAFSGSTADIASSGTLNNSVKNITVSTSNVVGAGYVEIFQKLRAYFTDAGSPLVGAIFALSNAAETELVSKTTSSTGYTGYSDYLTAYKITSSGNVNTGNDHTYTVTSGGTTGSAVTLTLSSANQALSASVDFTAPAGLASFAGTSVAGSGETVLTWTAATDTNFDHYEVWYGETQSDVQGRTGTATEWDADDDTDLATAATATTTITGLTLGTTYYFKIWGIDSGVNEATVDDVSVLTTAAVVAEEVVESGGVVLGVIAPAPAAVSDVVADVAAEATVEAPADVAVEVPVVAEGAEVDGELSGESVAEDFGGIDEEEILRKAASTVTDTVEEIVVAQEVVERESVEKEKPLLLSEDFEAIDSLIESYEAELAEAAAEAGEVEERFVETDFSEKLTEVVDIIAETGVVDEQTAAVAQEEVSNVFTASIGSAISKGSAPVALNMGGGVIVSVEDVEDVEIVFTNVLSEEDLLSVEADALDRGVTLVKANESTDLDNNGVPDFVQMKYDLGLYDDDADVDGWGLADEIGWHLNLNEPDDIPYLPKLTNLDGFVTGNLPQFKFIGSGRADVWVIKVGKNETFENVRDRNKDIFASVLLADIGEDISNSVEDLSKQVYVGEVIVDESKKATLVPDEPLSDGKYYVIVRNGGQVGSIKSFSVVENGLHAPELELLSEGMAALDLSDMSFEEVLLQIGKTVYTVFGLSEEASDVKKDDFISIYIEEFRQIGTTESFVLKGFAEPGKTLYITWKSAIFSSVVIADAQGEFKVELPDELKAPGELGEDHEVFAYVIDEKNSIMSSVARILFRR